MKQTKQQIRKEYDTVHEVFESLNMRQMTHLLYLMSDMIDIPHAFNDGKVIGMSVVTVGINGNKIQINTDFFTNHMENKVDEIK